MDYLPRSVMPSDRNFFLVSQVILRDWYYFESVSSDLLSFI